MVWATSAFSKHGQSQPTKSPCVAKLILLASSLSFGQNSVRLLLFCNEGRPTTRMQGAVNASHQSPGPGLRLLPECFRDLQFLRDTPEPPVEHLHLLQRATHQRHTLRARPESHRSGRRPRAAPTCFSLNATSQGTPAPACVTE